MSGRWISPDDEMPCTGELGFDRIMLDIPEYVSRNLPLNYEFDSIHTAKTFAEILQSLPNEWRPLHLKITARAGAAPGHEFARLIQMRGQTDPGRLNWKIKGWKSRRLEGQHEDRFTDVVSIDESTLVDLAVMAPIKLCTRLRQLAIESAAQHEAVVRESEQDLKNEIVEVANGTRNLNQTDRSIVHDEQPFSVVTSETVVAGDSPSPATTQPDLHIESVSLAAAAVSIITERCDCTPEEAAASLTQALSIEVES